VGFELIPPADPNVRVWRYSALWALLWAIEHRALHLTLLDELRRKHDPFEASVAKATKDDDMVVTSGNTMYTDGSLFGHANPSAPLRSLLEEDPQSRLGRIRRGLLRVAHASCWRHGEESAAMWRLYCGVNDGVAIQSTFTSLRDSIKDPDAFVSSVAYLDYETERLAIHRASYHPAIHKHRAFAHEQEVRVLRFREEDFNRADKEPSFRMPNNLSIAWEPESVIERIVVSPFCPAPYLATVQHAVQALSPALAGRVVASELGAEPRY
jgi:hypothetical protein